MADDNIDLRFLGKQVQTLQADVRELRAGYLRLDSDIVGLRADLAKIGTEMGAGFERSENRFEHMEMRLAAIETEMRAGFRAVDAKIDQVNQMMATDLQVILAAIGRSED